MALASGEILDGPTFDGDLQYLRAGGERLTPQRVLVLEAVRDLGGHVSAEMVAERVHTRFPTINRTTIYRTLTWLKEHGLVSETDTGRGQRVYEYLSGDRHHHLICQRCGGEQTISDEIVAPMLAEISARYGFQPRLDHLAVFGTCRACQEVTEGQSGSTDDDTAN